MKLATLKNLWQQPLVRAGILHIALLLSGWAVARGIASMLSLSVSVLGILLGYAVINIALTGWMLRRRVEIEPEVDQTADALAEFADDPLGGIIGDSKARLAKARKKVGRQAAMYQPLDSLVRQTRKIERRLALEPDLRAAFSPGLSQDLPLIAATAEQYVGLAGQELSPVQNERMIVAEGVLREAGDRLEGLLDSDGKVDAPVIGLIRMDTNAEVLAERLSTDTNGAAKRASAARVSHALRQAARAADEAFATVLQSAATRVDEMVAAEEALLPEDAPAIVEAAEAFAAQASELNKRTLRKQIRELM